MTGQYFGEQGLLVPDAQHTKIIRAKSSKLSTLAMDEPTFRHLMASSTKTQEEVIDVAQHGFAADAPAT